MLPNSTVICSKCASKNIIDAPKKTEPAPVANAQEAKKEEVPVQKVVDDSLKAVTDQLKRQSEPETPKSTETGTPQQMNTV